ncbi:hypothetical protein [Aquimarina algiphila]|uniref:Uncharacterized protein n=1 Tax=Aquimarina algiphila TaxID=2047982 RepID=A0A554VJA2_9FLAO|nr:hypothetical protein [Aquimarina algiphila]TSE07930.1 hypothetical protein FOF46_14490 [Aquimarina algiphila]
MKRIGIEDTLLEYHNVTGKNWSYSIKCIDAIPDDAFSARAVCINGAYIQFYEQININESSSIIFWALDFMKKELSI